LQLDTWLLGFGPHEKILIKQFQLKMFWHIKGIACAAESSHEEGSERVEKTLIGGVHQAEVNRESPHTLPAISTGSALFYEVRSWHQNGSAVLQNAPVFPTRDTL
jgi:hypothetical protein